jgi:hypothetical protein
VVVIPGGPAAIRAVSDDGLTFDMDSAAEGVGSLKVGDVMLASSLAAGRVARIDDGDGVRSVTLEPIQVTDLVADPVFDLDEAVDPATLVGTSYAEWPGMSDEEAGPDGPQGLREESRRIAPSPGPHAGDPVSVGSASVVPRLTSTEAGVNIVYNKDDLIAKADVGFQFDNLRLEVRGRPDHGDFTVVLHGLKGVTIDLAAGLGEVDPAGANKKLSGELPVSWTLPIPPSPATGGLPLFVQVKFTFQLITALGAKNSTLTAKAAYGLSGDLGLKDNAEVVPTLTVRQSMMDSLDGISLTATGFVAAVKLKLMLGLGTPATLVGPHVFLTAASGISKGSQIAINPDCRFASLDIKSGVGAGFELEGFVRKGIEKILKKQLQIAKLDVDKNLVVIRREQTLPEVAACTLGFGNTLG